MAFNTKGTCPPYEKLQRTKVLKLDCAIFLGVDTCYQCLAWQRKFSFGHVANYDLFSGRQYAHNEALVFTHNKTFTSRKVNKIVHIVLAFFTSALSAKGMDHSSFIRSTKTGNYRRSVGPESLSVFILLELIWGDINRSQPLLHLLSWEPVRNKALRQHKHKRSLT